MVWLLNQHKVYDIIYNIEKGIVKLNCCLCGKEIPEEEILEGEKYQICYECEVRAEYE